MTDLLLAGKVAIITGAGRGIGRAVAERFASLGAKLVLADNGASIDGKAHEPGVAQALAEKIGPAAVAFEQDMASPDAAADAVALAKEQFGGVDILVNNAAILRDAMVWKGDPADFDAVIRNNLSSAWYLANAATPLMRAQARKGARAGAFCRWFRRQGFTEITAYRLMPGRRPGCWALAAFGRWNWRGRASPPMPSCPLPPPALPKVCRPQLIC
ncbi:hypothetical protein JCM17843_22330 [Kordiimonadales bacterium JCM 17843]|nr:hypothetical protein JCM17843_22330 [Kordiimonadales bacterium JCM 17843]